MSFKKLGLSDPILRSLKELHHFEPSKIQKRAIPIVLSGNNLMAAAQTGTGKTGSFVLPIIEYLLDKPKPFKKHGKLPNLICVHPKICFFFHIFPSKFTFCY